MFSVQVLYIEDIRDWKGSITTHEWSSRDLLDKQGKFRVHYAVYNDDMAYDQRDAMSIYREASSRETYLAEEHLLCIPLTDSTGVKDIRNLNLSLIVCSAVHYSVNCCPCPATENNLLSPTRFDAYHIIPV